MRVHFFLAVLAAAGLDLASAKCSPAEQICGELCCCVTCTCLEGPFRCQDMWGKDTDPVGRIDDERFASREWTENMMREHHERHRQWLEEHEERRRQRRAERKARGEPEEEDELNIKDFEKRREARRKKRLQDGKKDDEMDEFDHFDLPEHLSGRLAEHKKKLARRKGGQSDGADVDHSDEAPAAADDPIERDDIRARVEELKARRKQRMERSELREDL